MGAWRDPCPLILCKECAKEDNMTLLVKNGRVINPATEFDDKADILVEDGIIKKVGKGIRNKADQVIDAKGCYVFPGFIDLHVHLRDPGFTEKETVETGMAAAAAGGYTTVFAMPNTKPVVDNRDVVSYVHHKAEAVDTITVKQIGAITIGQNGEKLADLEGMVEAGAPGFSEDGKSVMNSRVYYEAMIKAKELDVPIFAHCEDKNLVGEGAVHEGIASKKLGVPGILSTVENSIMARDMMLATDVGCRLHLCHCSTKECYNAVKNAQAYGLPISGEVTPHHFTLVDEDIVKPDTNFKMNPPVRTKEDREALRKGISEGVFVIATDHAPHTKLDKNASMKEAPFGIVGLETAAALTHDVLVGQKYLEPMGMARALSYGPAKIAGLATGDISEGKVADITIFDPEKSWKIDGDKFVGKSHNQPYNGRSVKGRVKYTIAKGKLVYEDDK